MWKTFEEFLRAYDVDAESIDDATRTKLRKIYDETKAQRDGAQAQTDEARATLTERFTLIMEGAGAAVATARADVKAKVLEHASGLVGKADVTAIDALRQIATKVAELVKTPAPGDITTADDQRTEVAMPVDREAVFSRKEIAAVYGQEREDRTLYDRAAESVLKHFEAGDELGMRTLGKDLEGSTGRMRVHDDEGAQPSVRLVTASSANTAVQSILTALLTKVYTIRPPVTDRLVTKIPSSAAEDTLPEVESEDGVRRVREGEVYPSITGTDRAVKVGHVKYGAALSQTRENAIFDKLGRMNVLMTSLSRQLVRYRDMFRLARICDYVSFDGRYISRPGNDNGDAVFYHTAADKRGNITSITNALVDYTDIGALRTQLYAMKLQDESYVMPELRYLLVPGELEALAWTILHSMVTSAALQVNPFGPGGVLTTLPEVITHPLVSTYLGAATTWLGGDFGAQFYEKVVWEAEIVPKLQGINPLRDIVSLWIGSFCVDMVALSDMFVVKNTA